MPCQYYYLKLRETGPNAATTCSRQVQSCMLICCFISHWLLSSIRDHKINTVNIESLVGETPRFCIFIYGLRYQRCNNGRYQIERNKT